MPERGYPAIHFRFIVDAPSVADAQLTLDMMLVSLSRFGEAEVQRAEPYYKFPDSIMVDAYVYPRQATAEEKLDALIDALQPPGGTSRNGLFYFAWSADMHHGQRMPGLEKVSWLRADALELTDSKPSS